jgi:hypothetical protein
MITAWIAAALGFAFGWAMCARVKEAESNLEIERLKKVFSKTAPVIIREMNTDSRN